jgi:hypothetical protein
MSYEDLWIVIFSPLDSAGGSAAPRAVGPFPTLEPAEEFARRLRHEWPGEVAIEVVQVESTEPISELLPE